MTTTKHKVKHCIYCKDMLIYGKGEDRLYMELKKSSMYTAKKLIMRAVEMKTAMVCTKCWNGLRSAINDTYTRC